MVYRWKSVGSRDSHDLERPELRQEDPMDNDQNGCGSVNHSEHMCLLFKKGCHTEIARLQKDPRYLCRTCGQKAHSSDNLCMPTLLGSGKPWDG